MEKCISLHTTWNFQALEVEVDFTRLKFYAFKIDYGGVKLSQRWWTYVVPVSACRETVLVSIQHYNLKLVDEFSQIIWLITGDVRVVE